MIKPSQDWLEKFNDTLVPETFVKITYSVTEPGAQSDASISTTGETSFSNPPSVLEEFLRNGVKVATGEKNFSILDGSVFLPDLVMGLMNAGYVSESCISETNHPTVTLSFSKTHDFELPGIMISWSTSFNEWATSFKLVAYSGNSVISEKTVIDNNSVTSDVDWPISGYDSISIQVLSWCVPDRRARIDQIRLGRFAIFDKDKIVSYKQESSRDPISGQLPNDNITFSVDNSSQEWNPFNPKGLYKYLYEQQPITVEYGMDVNGSVEWIAGGKFFLSEWNVTSNGIIASFSARDGIGLLMSTAYTGRMYGTLYEMAYDALEFLKEDALSFSISSELKNFRTDITKQNKSDYKNSDILQMVANAAGMTIYQNRYGTIFIDRIPEISTASERLAGEISIVNNFSWPEITFSKPIKAVSCTINVSTGNGNEKVSKTYSYPEQVSGNGITQTVSNPVISESVLSQEKNILTEAYKILSVRKKVSLDYRASPHFDALDFVRIHHQFGLSSILLTTKFIYEYSGCFHGTVEGYLIEEGESN